MKEVRHTENIDLIFSVKHSENSVSPDLVILNSSFCYFYKYFNFCCSFEKMPHVEFLFLKDLGCICVSWFCAQELLQMVLRGSHYAKNWSDEGPER